MSSTIHITNRSSTDLYVIAAANRDWSLADLGFSFVTTAVISAATAGTGGAAATATSAAIAKSIKTASNLYTIFDKFSRTYRVMDPASQVRYKPNYDYVIGLLHSSAIKVATGETKVVSEKSLNPFDGIKPSIPSDFGATYNGAKPANSTQDLRSLLSSAGAIKQVASNIANIINPSVFLSPISDVGDVTLFVANADFTKRCSFNTNSDHSWIVKNDEIVRAKKGTLVQEDRSAGWQIFCNSVGSILTAGEYLSPDESLDIQTVNFVRDDPPVDNTNDRLDDTPDAPMDDSPTSSSNVDDDSSFNLGNTLKQVGKFAGSAGSAIINAPVQIVKGAMDLAQTIGSSPYKLHYGRDGNLVLYKISGDSPKAVWSSGTAGRPAWRVCMQADGNLVIYSAQDTIEWALWRNMAGQDRRGSYVGLHKVKGHLGYYATIADDEPVFFVNEMQDANS